MARLQLGDVDVVGLTDIEDFDIPLATIFPHASPDALRNPPTWLTRRDYENGVLHLKIRSWLMRSSGRVILIDSCVGADKERVHHPHWHRRKGQEYLSSLAAEGLRPEDIDIVMCTHLHADHVGWNTRLENGRWVPTFPNARYVAGRREYEYWANAPAAIDRHGCIADSVTPVMDAGLMDLVDDGWELARGLTLTETPGHSPGHMCLKARAGPGAVFSGDVIHSPVQLLKPDWSSAFCADPDRSRISRRTLLEEVADSGAFLVPAHFADPGWTPIRRQGAAFAPI